MRYYIDIPPSELKFAIGTSTNDATIVLPATPDWLHRLDWIMWSFEDQPIPAGYLRVRDTTNNVLLHELKVSNKSHFKDYDRILSFGPEGFICPEHVEVTITLSSGNEEGGVTKRLTVQHR